MKTVIEMAREAGFPFNKYGLLQGNDDNEIDADAMLERFAELVRADEREKYKWDIHSCGPTCTNAVCVVVRKAVKAEREACAKVCETYREWDDTGMGIAAAIRARSNT